MSVRPQDVGPASEVRKKVTIQTLFNQKANGTPISMVTAYDYPTAVACSSQAVDITLVGDSLAQVCLGYPSTTRLTVSEMIHHARAVSRGTTHPFLVADMPFGSYHTGIEDALKNAVRMVQEGRVDAVKMEGGQEISEVVRKLTTMGIPVMAHVGLLPQRHTALSGYKVQGRDRHGAKRILSDALALQDAGAFSIVLEAIPKELGKYITEKLQIPTIGIGAGPHTDGQVLVWDDLLGTWNGHKAKFLVLTTLALLHPPSRAYIDPWTGELFREGGVEQFMGRPPSKENAPLLAEQPAKGAEGGVIMGKLANATAKAALGRATWKLLHTMTLRYPESPTADERDALNSYFHLTSRLYPCGDCATHFQALLKKFPPQTSSRRAASSWLCFVHNQVNERLKKPIFDCAHLDDEYDCGCGDDPTSTKKTSAATSTDALGNANEPMDLERDPSKDAITNVQLIKGGR
ncbi:hypothetical protein ONZ45_g5322 [Pleurotus djamor]|nr:hypothetical protein ONZ45_g5322 [Pleurotus djamor]